MLSSEIFKKTLYMVAYGLFGILFTIGLFSGNNEIIIISWIHLVIGALLNLNYFVYTLKNRK